jgi:hypothetical protein
MGYFAYLVSGWNYFLEENQLLATADFLKTSNTTRQLGKGIFETSVGSSTTRGAAWSIRTLAQAATITPDGDALRSEFVNSLDEEHQLLPHALCGHAQQPAGAGAAVRQLHHNRSVAKRGVDGRLLHRRVRLAEGPAGLRRATLQIKVDQFLSWKYRSVVGRLGGSGSTEYSYRYATQYNLPYAPSISADYASGKGPWYASWAEVARVMALPTSGAPGETLVSGYPEEATGYWGNLMPAISYAVDHGAAGASTAYNRILNASNFPTQAAAYNDNPVWGLKPRCATCLPQAAA